MQISDESVGGVCVVTARGRLDGAASGLFGERVQSLIRPERPKMLIDFTGIDFVTSAGLRVVLTILKKVKSANGVFALCGVQASVREVLEITGFAGMIQIFPGREAALAALS
jgi:anti-anti-sigma factor